MIILRWQKNIYIILRLLKSVSTPRNEKKLKETFKPLAHLPLDKSRGNQRPSVVVGKFQR